MIAESNVTVLVHVIRFDLSNHDACVIEDRGVVTVCSLERKHTHLHAHTHTHTHSHTHTDMTRIR